MNATDRILGETTHDRVRLNPHAAYWHAKYLKGRFPEGEASISKNPEVAYRYAYGIIKGRWPEGEEAIAKDPYWREEYLKLFPGAKDDWVLNGWLEWLA